MPIDMFSQVAIKSRIFQYLYCNMQTISYTEKYNSNHAGIVVKPKKLLELLQLLYDNEALSGCEVSSAHYAEVDSGSVFDHSPIAV